MHNKKSESLLISSGDEFLESYLEVLATLERLHRLLLDVIKDEFERLSLLDINAIQALLLFNIGDKEVTAGELKSRGYYQGSNVSYNLKKMVEYGYISHKKCAIDRRAVRIKLTKKGNFIYQTVGKLFMRHTTAIKSDNLIWNKNLKDIIKTFHMLERFWTEQIRYIY